MHKLEIENEKIKFLNNEDVKTFFITIIYYIKNIINIMKNNTKYNIIYNYKYIFLILLIINNIFSFNTEDLINENINNGEEIMQKGKRKYLKLEMINKFNSYIQLCDNIEFIKNKKFQLIKKPKISVIIPIYNGGKYLKHSLCSIQNQNIKDIEIILIDDFSTDNTIIIIEEYMKNDQRIRLIKNNKNKKILYSKSIGALNSKGEYIIQLDQDDMFIREDAFKILYFEAKRYKLDLIQMRDFVKKDFFFHKKTSVNQFGLHWIYQKITHYKIQPELNS